ncbi:MAG: CRISPR-associated helicase/endonuclease Cas3 [Armatimonadota bacterium]|jgi:CRISPR-associated endonuclease/helicase Cas3|nr:MAG: CRISPR-associated helicase/endonuclease Cas3 [Armatimonadota bacterium]
MKARYSSLFDSLDCYLAKSDGTTLKQHTLDVLNYIKHLTDDERAHLAAVYHDLGKQASGFQRQLEDSGFKWHYRHEVLSALIYLMQEEFDPAVFGAILTHHRDIEHPHNREPEGSISAHLRNIGIVLDKAGELPVPVPEDIVRKLVEHTKYLRYGIDEGIYTDHVLLRGYLIAADHAASAGLKQPVQVKKVNLNISPRGFQQQAAETEGNLILEAPTGSGKTEAALLWYDRNRNGNRRLFYVLPYQSSIEAMQERFVQRGVFQGDEVGVVHGRDMLYAFRRYMDEGNEDLASQQAKQDANLNRLVHKPVKITTPYQLLNYLIGIKRFEVGIVQMKDACFVFDEIHAYDSSTLAMITVLIDVIQQLGGKVMVMSATLPEPLVDELKRRLHNVKHIVADVALPDRHYLKRLDQTLEDCIPLIRRDLELGKSVLVVCNRVDQAVSMYQTFSDIPSRRLLHSRFMIRDRSRIENDILHHKPQLLIATQVVEVSLDISYDTCYTEVAPVDDLLQRFGRVNRRGEHGIVDVHVATTYDAGKLEYVYDEEYLKNTLNAISEQAISWHVQRDWVNHVYQNMLQDRRYLRKLDVFSNHVRSMKAYITTTMEDIEQKIAGTIDVVPACYLDEFMQLTDEGRYLQARELLVPVPFEWKQWYGNRISYIGSGSYTIDADYSEEYGLVKPEKGEGNSALIV